MLGVSRPRPRRTSPRRTASWPASCTPTPTPTTRRPRSGSRRSRRPTTSSVTRPSARSTTRCARLGPMGGMGGPGGWVASADRAEPTATSRSPTRRTSATCSAGSSTAAVGGVAVARPVAWSWSPAGRRSRGRAAPVVPRRRQRGRDLGQPRVRGDVLDLSRQRGQAGHRADGLPALPRPRRARRQPGLLLVQHAVPRVRRSRARSSPTRAPPATAGGRAPSPRGQGPHPRRRARRSAHPAQGPRWSRPQRWSAGRPLRRRPTWPPIRSSDATVATSPSPCRSPIPRPRSAPSSRCRRSKATPSPSSCRRAPARAGCSGSRVGASTPRRAAAT